MRRRLPLFVSAVAALALGGCPSEESPAIDAGTGGGCPAGPVAMLDLTITAEGAPVPADTRLAVSWSAGDEPVFALDDPKTWGTLANANVVCDVDPAMPPPDKLAALVCHLWTSGPTKVKVTASGYASYASTLAPDYSARCKGPVPTAVQIALAPLPDGGAN